MDRNNQRDHPREAWRLICDYDNDGVHLRARRRLEAIAPPESRINPERPGIGFWVEVRDADERTLYARVMHNPMAATVEATVGEPGSLAQRRTASQQGTFALLVPAIEGNSHVCLMERKPGAGAAQARGTEIARLPLDGSDFRMRDDTIANAHGRVVGTTKLVDHGPDLARWNLVMLGDGYQHNELGTFHNDVQDFCNTLFSTPPFDAMEDAINIHRIDVESTDSGANNDDPVPCHQLPDTCNSTVSVNTFFDATFCPRDNPLDRLLTVNTKRVMRVAEEQVPEWTIAMVIVNSQTRGGAGAQAVAVFTPACDGQDVALHELGHSAFGLADEYDFLEGCCCTGTDFGCNGGCDDEDDRVYRDDEPMEANITANPNRDTLKWRHLVDRDTSLPTKENPNCDDCDREANPEQAGTVGAYEGAGYYRCGLYRPEFDCRMRISNDPFCAVCQDHIREVLNQYMPSERRKRMDFTLITPTIHHFGDEEDFPLPGGFVGRSKELKFDCPGVNPRQHAVLLFQLSQTDNFHNIMEINGTKVHNSVPHSTKHMKAWFGNVVLVEPNTLKSVDNTLYIEARDNSGGTTGNLDDFAIDNIVVMYKTL